MNVSDIIYITHNKEGDRANCYPENSLSNDAKPRLTICFRGLKSALSPFNVYVI